MQRVRKTENLYPEMKKHKVSIGIVLHREAASSFSRGGNGRGPMLLRALNRVKSTGEKIMSKGGQVRGV